MEDKLQILHTNLIKEGYDLPDYNTFKTDMSDPAKSLKLHGSLVGEGYDLPDYDTFLGDMSLKKKGYSLESLAEGKNPLESLGIKSEVPLTPPSPSESPKPKDRATTVTGDLLRTLKSGVLGAAGGIAETPMLISRTIHAITSRPIIKAMGGTDEEAEQFADYMRSTSTFGQSMGIGEQAQGEMDKLAKKTEEKMMPIEGSIVENLGKGELAKAGELLLRGVVQSLPYLAMTAATAGGGTVATLGTIGATAAGQQYGSLAGQKEGTRVLNSWMYGGFEAAGELVTAGLLRGVGKAFRRGATKTVDPNFVKGFSKEMTKAFFGESSSEMATQIGQNFTDIITGVDPNRNIFDGVLDAGLIGGFSGAGIGGANIAANVIGRTIASDKEVAQVQENINQQGVLINQIETTDSDPVKTALEDRLKTLTYEANKVMDANYHLAEQMSPEQKMKAAELYSVWNDLQAKIDNKEVTEQGVPALENTIEGIKEQLQALKQEVASDVAKKEEKNVVEEKVKEGEPKPETLTPEEIAKKNDITYIGKQEGLDKGTGLDLYNVEANGQQATFSVPEGSNELTVKAKKEAKVKAFKPEEFKLGDKTFKTPEELTSWLDKNYNENDRFSSVNEEGYLEPNTMKVFNEWYKENKERLAKEEMDRITKIEEEKINAETTGGQVKEGGQQPQGVVEGEETGVRVRDNAEDRVEAPAGEEVIPVQKPEVFTGLEQAPKTEQTRQEEIFGELETLTKTPQEQEQHHTEVTKTLEDLTKKAPNAMPIKVVKTQDELPPELKDQLKSLKANKVNAVYDPNTNTVYFVSKNLTSVDDALAKWVHEQGIHNGLRILFPNETQLTMFLEKVFNDIGVQKIAETVDIAYTNANKNGVLSNEEYAEEYLAKIAEKIITKQTLNEAEKGIWQKLLDLIRKNISKLMGKDIPLTDEQIADIVRAGVGTLYDKGIRESKTKGRIDPLASVTSWESTDKETLRSDMLKAGVNEKVASVSIQNINEVSSVIQQYPFLLDYEADQTVSSLKANAEPYYKTSRDFATICRKAAKLLATVSQIQIQLKRGLNEEEWLSVREAMRTQGDVVSCGLCYVFSRKAKIGDTLNKMQELYPEIPVEVLFDPRRQSELAQYPTSEKQAKAIAKGSKMSAKDIMKKFPNALAWLKGRGAGLGKAFEARTDYRREFTTLGKTTIERQNKVSGQRAQSWSDFEALHLIDLMQSWVDASVMGLMMHSYTKEIPYAVLASQTNEMVNMSLVPKGLGLDENGELAFDDVEGINPEEAFKTRDKQGNAGTILVGVTDEHIRKAMADPRIDYIIPYHPSGLAKGKMKLAGVEGWQNYEAYQEEEMADKAKFAKYMQWKTKEQGMTSDQQSVRPWEYWDTKLDGDQNAKKYLEYCKKNGIKPKFEQFSGDKGYWKLLVDRRMYDNNGKFIEQKPIQPNFDMDYIKKYLDEVVKGERPAKGEEIPNQKVVEEFVKKQPKASAEDTDLLREKKIDAIVRLMNINKEEGKKTLSKEDITRLEGYGIDQSMIEEAHDRFRGVVPEGKQLGAQERVLNQAESDQQQILSDIIDENKEFYDVLHGEQAVRNANQFIEDKGIEGATRDLEGDTRDLTQYPTRQVARMILIDHYTRILGRSTSTKAEKDNAYLATEKLQSILSREANKTGQGNAHLNLWKVMQPAGLLEFTKRKINEFNKKKLQRKIKDKTAGQLIDALYENISETNKKVIDNILEGKEIEKKLPKEPEKPRTIPTKRTVTPQVVKQEREYRKSILDAYKAKKAQAPKPSMKASAEGTALSVDEIELAINLLGSYVREGSYRQADVVVRLTSDLKTVGVEVSEEDIQTVLGQPYKGKATFRSWMASEEAKVKLRSEMKSLKVRIADVVKIHWSERDALGRTLAQKLVDEAGLTEPEATTLANAILEEYNNKIDERLATNKDLANLIGKEKIPVKKKGKKSMMDKMRELINLGAFNEELFRDLFAEKLGLSPNLTDEQGAMIIHYANTVQQMTGKGWFYRDAVIDMAKYMYEITPQSMTDEFIETWVALAYANMLSGIPTTVLNLWSSGSNMVLKPLRDMVNFSRWDKMLRGRNTGGKADIYFPGGDMYYLPLFQGIAHGAKEAAEVYQNGDISSKFVEAITSADQFRVSQLERNKYGKGKRFKPLKVGKIDLNLGNLMKYVGRNLSAQDRLMWSSDFDMEITQILRENLVGKGLKGKALRDAVINYIQGSKIDMAATLQQIEDEAKQYKELTGKETSDRQKKIRLRELIVKALPITEEQKVDAEELARQNVFTGERGGLIATTAYAIGRAVNSSPLAGLLGKGFFPFTKIVGNVTESMIDYTPFYGFFRANGWSPSAIIKRKLMGRRTDPLALTAQMGERGSILYYEQMGRAWLGTMTFVSLAAFLMWRDDDDDIQLSGGYNQEAFKKGAGKANVMPKYTLRIKIGDQNIDIPYLNIPGLAIPLGIIGNYNDALRAKMPEEEVNLRLLASMLVAGPKENPIVQTMFMVKDMSFITGAQDLMEMLTNIFTTDEYKWKQAGLQLVRTYLGFALKPLPQNATIVQQTWKFFDPASYSAKDIKGVLAYSAGLQHIYGYPTIDQLGEEMKTYPGENLMPYTFWFNIKGRDARWRFLADNNAIPNKVNNFKTHIEDDDPTMPVKLRSMEPQELYNYSKEVGNIFTKDLEAYMKDAKKVEKRSNDRISEEKNGEIEVSSGIQEDVNKMWKKAREEAKIRVFSWYEFKRDNPADWDLMVQQGALQPPVTALPEIEVKKEKITLTREQLKEYNQYLMEDYHKHVIKYLKNTSKVERDRLKPSRKNYNNDFEQELDEKWTDAKATAKSKMEKVLKGELTK